MFKKTKTKDTGKKQCESLEFSIIGEWKKFFWNGTQMVHGWKQEMICSKRKSAFNREHEKPIIYGCAEFESQRCASL